MEAYDVVEQRLRDGESRVGVAERNEVDHLGETVHHCENNGLAADLGKTLDEVHGDVAPHGRRNLEGL